MERLQIEALAQQPVEQRRIELVERKGLAQVSDPAVIRDAAQRVLERNKAQVEQYRAGKTQVFGFLVGQLMKETRGKAKAELANEILLELLSG